MKPMIDQLRDKMRELRFTSGFYKTVLGDAPNSVLTTALSSIERTMQELESLSDIYVNHRASSTIVIDGLTLSVKYNFTPSETRNEGHPDSRLPNEAFNIEIIDIVIEDFDPAFWSKYIAAHLNQGDEDV